MSIVSPADADPGLTYWTKADEARYPWARKETREALRAWITEAENADKLTAVGEKVYPLLLSGPTRCGKTSTMCAIAKEYFGIPSYRMQIASVIDSYMGQTTRNVRAALAEASTGPNAVWIMDEIDGLFPQRNKGGRGSEQEMNAALSVALTIVESLPQHLILVGTTNQPEIIDRAMLSRFTHVRFPEWSDLTDGERRAFARSHKVEEAWTAQSYAEAVQVARRERVQRILKTEEEIENHG